jgi:ribonuclease III
LAEGDREQLRYTAAQLGYGPDSMGRLLEAVTHKSYANENADRLPYNERLEFLGDAVLGMLVADALMRHHPDLEEGRLTPLRASLVNARSLADAARSLRLGGVLSLGKGEERSGGRDKSNLLADAFEAVLAAVYLDLGLEAARAVVEGGFGERLRSERPIADHRDHKTRLHEWAQAVHQQQPTYNILSETGPDHEKHFEVELVVAGTPLAVGRGRSKKEAQRKAAKVALQGIDADATEKGSTGA